MVQTRTITDALDDFMSSLNLTDELRTLIGRANTDLYHGPLYLDDDDEECCCFDDGARQFDFSAAVDTIGAAFDDVGTIYVDAEAGCWWTSEPEGELFDTGEEDEDGDPIVEWIEPYPYFMLERREVLDHILGRELAHYVA